MHTELQLILTPEQAEKKELLQKVVSEKLGITSERISLIRTLRKSIDARGVPKINLSVEVFWDEEAPGKFEVHINYKFVGNKPSVLVA